MLHSYHLLQPRLRRPRYLSSLQFLYFDSGPTSHSNDATDFLRRILLSSTQKNCQIQVGTRTIISSKEKIKISFHVHCFFESLWYRVLPPFQQRECLWKWMVNNAKKCPMTRLRSLYRFEMRNPPRSSGWNSEKRREMSQRRSSLSVSICLWVYFSASACVCMCLC